MIRDSRYFMKQISTSGGIGFTPLFDSHNLYGTNSYSKGATVAICTYDRDACDYVVTFR